MKIELSNGCNIISRYFRDFAGHTCKELLIKKWIIFSSTNMGFLKYVLPTNCMRENIHTKMLENFLNYLETLKKNFFFEYYAFKDGSYNKIIVYKKSLIY